MEQAKTNSLLCRKCGFPIRTMYPSGLVDICTYCGDVGYEINKSAQHRLHLTAFGVVLLAFLAGFVVCWLAFVR
jgi:hypothetical protein